MSLKNHVCKAVDVSIVLGYSAFAFAIMPALVIAAWLIERVAGAADLADSES
ncbi:MAG: hypothetical protein AAF327_17405 [Cyanobacteria bacterium P01_A01_bin.37]